MIIARAADRLGMEHGECSKIGEGMVAKKDGIMRRHLHLGLGLKFNPNQPTTDDGSYDGRRLMDGPIPVYPCFPSLRNGTIME